MTGNIAMGKSTVLAMLAALGADVIDADGLVHQLITCLDYRPPIPGRPAEKGRRYGLGVI